MLLYVFFLYLTLSLSLYLSLSSSYLYNNLYTSYIHNKIMWCLSPDACLSAYRNIIIIIIALSRMRVPIIMFWYYNCHRCTTCNIKIIIVIIFVINIIRRRTRTADGGRTTISAIKLPETKSMVFGSQKRFREERSSRASRRLAAPVDCSHHNDIYIITLC